MPSRAELAKLSLLVGLSCVLWLVVALLGGRVLATGLAPLLRWEITQLAPKYQVVDLRVVEDQGETAIMLRVKTTTSRAHSGRVIPSGAAMSSSTLVGNLFQPLVVMLSLVSTASVWRRGQAPVLTVLAVPAAFSLVMMDTPFVLVGALDDLVWASLTPSAASWSPWVIWMNVLNGGGRLALGIGAGLIVIGLASGVTASADRRAISTRHTGAVGSA